MIIELTPEQRAAADLAMPRIFDTEGFHPDRIEWYTRLVVESGLIFGGALVVPEFIAAMIGEAGLNNAGDGSVGNNAKNGTPYAHPGFASLGISWCQLDTNYHVRDLDHMHRLRRDPLEALKYVADEANGLVRHGAEASHFSKQAWHAWEMDMIDPHPSTGGWSALKAARRAWDVVTA